MTAPGATARARMRKAWGDAAPDWIVALAAACDADSQAAVARRLGVSAGLVSGLLNRTYLGRLDRSAARLRPRLVDPTVDCPELGRISETDCLTTRRRPLSAASADSVRQWRACRACPRDGKARGGSEC